MTADEFIKKLVRKYKEPAEIDLDDIRNWTEKYNLTDLQYEELYEIVIESHVYKTLPSLADIKKWWTKRADKVQYGASMQALTKTVLDYAKDKSIPEIIKTYRACRDDEHMGNDTIAIRVQFVNVFSDLYNSCMTRKDGGHDTASIIQHGEVMKGWLYEGA